MSMLALVTHWLFSYHYSFSHSGLTFWNHAIWIPLVSQLEKNISSIYLSLNVIISPSLCKDCFTGYTVRGWQPHFPSASWRWLIHPLSASGAAVNRESASVCEDNLSSSLWDELRVVFPSLVVWSFVTMCLGMHFFLLSCLEFLWFSKTETWYFLSVL